MPLQQTSGNVTQDAYGGGKAVVPTYVENVFSTYLYNGTGAVQSIVNNIDLADNGGLVWIKGRQSGSYTFNNLLFDTARGPNISLISNLTIAQYTWTDHLNSFNTNGFTLGVDTDDDVNNPPGYKFASWTFRKQPKFFDIVTFTADGSGNASISHNLGSIPGCIITKRTNGSENWIVYHTGYNNGTNATHFESFLNTSGAAIDAGYALYSATSTNISYINSNLTPSGTYVAYIFGAGGTGGFGLTGTQDIISCGSFTTDGSGNATVNLGWEPQWILYKEYDAASGWIIDDTMRGLSYVGEQRLSANSSGGEINVSPGAIVPTATGFNVTNSILPGSTSWIYIAIRRGPMATPTTGTSVYNPDTYTGNGSASRVINSLQVTDLTISGGLSGYQAFSSRLIGSAYQFSNSPNAEATGRIYFDQENGYRVGDGTSAYQNNSSVNYMDKAFARSPGFFDIVCYTGAGSATTQNHNLGVIPQLMIFKSRSNTADWFVYCAYSNAGSGPEATTLRLDSNVAAANSTNWNSTPPTSTLVNLSGFLVGSGQTYVGYLFATVSGVSYVGSYTGNGTGQSIACGFGAGGARFILIKRTDSTGDWYMFDSANGLTSTSSPYVLIDTTSSQTTGNNGVYASSGGFTLGSTASTTTNISSASYIFLSIA